ncbi:MAG: hypothetical protein AAGG44_18370, partial [Planctomycetota bacterium]
EGDSPRYLEQHAADYFLRLPNTEWRTRQLLLQCWLNELELLSAPWPKVWTEEDFKEAALARRNALSLATERATPTWVEEADAQLHFAETQFAVLLAYREQQWRAADLVLLVLRDLIDWNHLQLPVDHGELARDTVLRTATRVGELCECLRKFQPDQSSKVANLCEQLQSMHSSWMAEIDRLQADGTIRPSFMPHIDAQRLRQNTIFTRWASVYADPLEAKRTVKGLPDESLHRAANFEGEASGPNVSIQLARWHALTELAFHIADRPLPESIHDAFHELTTIGYLHDTPAAKIQKLATSLQNQIHEQLAMLQDTDISPVATQHVATIAVRLNGTKRIMSVPELAESETQRRLNARNRIRQSWLDLASAHCDLVESEIRKPNQHVRRIEQARILAWSPSEKSVSAESISARRLAIHAPNVLDFSGVRQRRFSVRLDMKNVPADAEYELLLDYDEERFLIRNFHATETAPGQLGIRIAHRTGTIDLQFEVETLAGTWTHPERSSANRLIPLRLSLRHGLDVLERHFIEPKFGLPPIASVDARNTSMRWPMTNESKVGAIGDRKQRDLLTANRLQSVEFHVRNLDSHSQTFTAQLYLMPFDASAPPTESQPMDIADRWIASVGAEAVGKRSAPANLGALESVALRFPAAKAVETANSRGEFVVRVDDKQRGLSQLVGWQPRVLPFDGLLEPNITFDARTRTLTATIQRKPDSPTVSGGHLVDLAIRDAQDLDLIGRVQLELADGQSRASGMIRLDRQPRQVLIGITP